MKTPEEIFLMNALPAAMFCSNAKANALELEEKFIKREFPSRQELEEMFPAAFKRIKQFANSENPEKFWTPEIVKDYWLKEHNRIIDNKEDGYDKFTDELREFCKVSLGIVLEINPDDDCWIVLVNFKEKEIKLKSHIKLEKGDKISFHLGQVVAKLSEEDINKYF